MPRQQDLADAVGVAVTAVSAWERAGEKGGYEPSAANFLLLAIVAAGEGLTLDARWFLEQTGFDEQRLKVIFGELLKWPPNEMAAALLSSLPSKTLTLVLDEKSAGLAFAPGDVILVDQTATAGQEDELQPLIGRPVLFDFPLRSQRGGDRMGSWKDQQIWHWPEGLSCGRLRLSTLGGRDDLTWTVTVAPLFHEGAGPVVGYWRHPSPPEEPAEGSERKQVKEEVEKANILCHELWEKQAKRSGSAVEQTPQMVEAGRVRAEAQNRLSRAKEAEEKAAREEAKLLAPTNIRLFGGRVVGRVIAWFSLSGEQKR